MNETAKTWITNAPFINLTERERRFQNTRLKLLHHAPDAHYRAVASPDMHRTGCFPNTRTEVLQDLREWVHYTKLPKIYRLSGTAGVGKTTIAYSLCEWLENSGKPAASFFCSRDLPDCRDVKRILPTVSYQLAQLSRPFRCAISSTLEQDPKLGNRPVDEQFKRLIAEPFQKVGHTFGVDVVIVLDALDDCEHKDGVNQLLEACFKDTTSLPVRFLITSRQNLRILHRTLISELGSSSTELQLHEVDRTVAQQDVRTYLQAELEHLGLSEDDIECLVQRSGRWFLYAASVVNYTGRDDVPGGAGRLKRLLDTSCYTDTSPNQDIDALCTTILEEAFDQTDPEDLRKAEVMLILRTALCAQEPVTMDTVAGLLKLDFHHSVRTVLRPLLPVLHVSNADELGMTLHDSFASYLSDPRRSGKFYCDVRQDHALLAQLCFDVINMASPAFNVCNLESSYLLDREVADIDQKVKDSISQIMGYASRHWATHLVLAGPSEALLTSLHNFLSRRLLLWMEVMNLQHYISGAVELLHSVSTWLQEVKCPFTIQVLILDAWKFTAAFSSSAVSKSTPHIYVSALQFWPVHQPVSRHYMHMLRNGVNTTRTRLRSRGDDPMFRSGPVTRVAHPPQGLGAISDWAVRTGQPVGTPFSGHDNPVNSVVYSPNGAYIVSCASSKTALIWDADTCRSLCQSLHGHTDWVLSVAYSPDGAYIASGSDDWTVRIWDARTGRPVGGPLNGHSSSVRSVAYSPSGAYIVSGSFDNTVRIWDAHTGLPVGWPLNGHTDWVQSVAFSPDSAYIVSGSFDNTVRVWDARTGKPVGMPLTGHTDWVNSVAYSPDGAYIASGSYDNTVRIWDARTGQLVGQPLSCHTDRVNSVVYSPDGAYIASGSHDKTVRIWDAHAGQPVGQPFNGHTERVNSVVYSPDGAYIVSGSDDCTIRIWESPARHGAQQPEALLQPTSPNTRTPGRSLILSAFARYITRTSREPNPARMLACTCSNL
ncbi:hypothetical protein FRC10_009644 [Ceratobasidium sp. 414]|nr:hypothetical protein FRC10_009644 [Ceratobasidium sp. 414]